MEKADYNEELSKDGLISKSKMRQMSGIALWSALIYLFIASISNLWFWNRILNLLELKILDETLFKILAASFTGINIMVFLILIVAAFVPKALQKFAETQIK